MNQIIISYIGGDPLGLRKYRVEDGQYAAVFEVDITAGFDAIFDEAKRAYVKARYEDIVKEIPF